MEVNLTGVAELGWRWGGSCAEFVRRHRPSSSAAATGRRQVRWPVPPPPHRRRPSAPAAAVVREREENRGKREALEIEAVPIRDSFHGIRVGVSFPYEMNGIGGG